LLQRAGKVSSLALTVVEILFVKQSLVHSQHKDWNG